MTDKLYLITEAQVKEFSSFAEAEGITGFDKLLQSLPMVDNKPYAWMNPDDLCADTAFRWVKLNEFTNPLYTSPQALTKISADDVTDEMVKEYDRLCYDEDATPKQHLAVVFNAVAAHLVKPRSEA